MKEPQIARMSIGVLRELPLSEKLQIMEAIWEELRLNAEGIPVPQWHRDLLDSRQKTVEEKREEILEWDDVKDLLGGAAL